MYICTENNLKFRFYKTKTSENMKRLMLIIFFVVSIISSSIGQDSNISTNDTITNEGATLSINADFVSRYLWRGLPLCSNPSIQPYVSIDYKGFSIGAWASYGIATPYAEIDLFLSYSAGNFTFTLNDYFNEDEPSFTSNNYFDWNESSTFHTLEGAISYEGPESFPISFTAATFFYGYDQDNGKNLYSTYLELGYNTQIGETPVKLFIGGTPMEGYYSDGAAIVNAGVTVSKNILVNDNFEIPVNASFIVNPDNKDVFFVIGFTF